MRQLSLCGHIMESPQGRQATLAFLGIFFFTLKYIFHNVDLYFGKRDEPK